MSALFAWEKIRKEGIFIERASNIIPIWQKSNLTVEEAAAYSGIGINKIRDLSNNENCPFVLWVGSKRLIKRRIFDTYIEKQYSI